MYMLVQEYMMNSNKVNEIYSYICLKYINLFENLFLHCNNLI